MSSEEREAIEGYVGGAVAGVRRRVGAGLYEVYVGEAVDVPKVGALLWLGEVSARVERHVGSGLVEARCLSCKVVPALDDGVRLAQPPDVLAAFEAPEEEDELSLEGRMFCEAHRSGALSYEVPRPRFMELDGSREALTTGVKALDVLSPMARGGLNVLVNLSDELSALKNIAPGVQRALPESTSVELVVAGSAAAVEGAAQVRCEAGWEGVSMGLRALASWCVAQRAEGMGEQVVWVVLPELGEALGQVDVGAWPQSQEQTGRGVTVGEVLSWLGEALASTHKGGVTVVVEVRLARAARQLGALLETLTLGGVDALIVVDEEGCYEPWRSTSAAERPDAEQRVAQSVRGALSRAARAGERARLFGEEELEEEERAVLAEVSVWRERF